MMGIVARLLPPLLSLGLLAAHYFRKAPFPTVKFMFVGIALVLMLLLLIPNRWTVKPVQLVLLLGGWEWIATMLRVMAERQAEGAPYLRMCVILSAGTLFTWWSAFLPSLGRLKRDYYGKAPSSSEA